MSIRTATRAALVGLLSASLAFAPVAAHAKSKRDTHHYHHHHHYYQKDSGKASGRAQRKLRAPFERSEESERQTERRKRYETEQQIERQHGYKTKRRDRVQHHHHVYDHGRDSDRGKHTVRRYYKKHTDRPFKPRKVKPSKNRPHQVRPHYDQKDRRGDRHHHYHYHHYHWYGDDRWVVPFVAGVLTLGLFAVLTQPHWKRFEVARIEALNAPLGETIVWHDGHVTGTVTALRDGRNELGQYCREYQQTVTIGGRYEVAYGTACLQADGVWRILS